MGWTERQSAMLRAMGLRVWPTPTGVAGAAPAGDAGVTLTSAAGATDAVAISRAASGRQSSERRDIDRQRGHRPHSDRPLSDRPLSDRPPSDRPFSDSPRSDRSLSHSPLIDTPSSDAPSSGALATLDWPALRDAVAACRACSLCESRRQTVFGVGHPQAHWMVVGEAPGEQEDAQGEPFVGAAGQLLDRMLQALALTRSSDGAEPPAQRVYIANTLKCRPPRNRNPAPEEMAQCEPFLVRQIELLRPRIILAMGRFAVQALLRSNEPVGKLRGRVHRYQGVPLVVTYHPAYLLRNLADKAKAWDDLCLAASTVEALGARP